MGANLASIVSIAPTYPLESSASLAGSQKVKATFSMAKTANQCHKSKYLSTNGRTPVLSVAWRMKRDLSCLLEQYHAVDIGLGRRLELAFVCVRF
jgi:hypothetical protein